MPGRLNVTVRFGPGGDVGATLGALRTALAQQCQWEPLAEVTFSNPEINDGTSATGLVVTAAHGPLAQQLVEGTETAAPWADEVLDERAGVTTFPTLVPWQGQVDPPRPAETQRWFGAGRWWVGAGGTNGEPTEGLVMRQRLDPHLGGQLVPVLWVQVDLNRRGLQVQLLSRSSLWLAARRFDPRSGGWVVAGRSQAEAAPRNAARYAAVVRQWLAAQPKGTIQRVLVEPIHAPHAREQQALLPHFADLPELDRWWEAVIVGERPPPLPPVSLLEGL